MSLCIVYCVDENDLYSNLILNSLSTFKYYNDESIDVVVITNLYNHFLKHYLKIIPNLKTIVVDFDLLLSEISFVGNLRGKSKVPYIKLFSSLIEQFSLYQKIVFADADVQFFADANQLFALIQDQDTIYGIGYEHKLNIFKDAVLQYDSSDIGIDSVKKILNRTLYIDCGICGFINSEQIRQKFADIKSKIVSALNSLKFCNKDNDMLNLFFNIKEFDKAYASSSSDDVISVVKHFNTTKSDYMSWIQNKISSVASIAPVREKIEIPDLLAHSFVLSCDKKRLQTFNTIFEKASLTPLPKEYSGFLIKHITTTAKMTFPQGDKYRSFSANALLGHISMIKLAKILDWPYVCIFEDDAYPCLDILEKLDYYLSHIPVNTMCLCLGNYRLSGITPYRQYLRMDGTIMGGHSYIIFKEGYDMYIKNSNVDDDGEVACDATLHKLRNTYMPAENLFIEYCVTPGQTVGVGYNWCGRSALLILWEFPIYQDNLK